MVDLRFVSSLHAQDIYDPTGPFELSSKDGKEFKLAVTRGEHETAKEAEVSREVHTSRTPADQPASQPHTASSTVVRQPSHQPSNRRRRG